MRNGVIVMTIISGLLFSFIMVSSSLSPFPSPDEFNSLGMWANVIFLLFFYVLSLIVYMAGVKAMKYVMAVFCGIGLLMAVSIIALAIIIGAVNSNIFDFIGVIVLCMMALIVNVVWYIVTFKRKKTDNVTDL